MKEKTVQDVLDTFNEEQLQVLYYMIGLAVKKNQNEDNKDNK